MATITKRGKRWFVQVRRKGHTPQFSTFDTKAEARRWATTHEAELLGQPIATDEPVLTLAGLLNRYLREVTPSKRSAESEALRLGKLLRDPIADVRLPELTPARIANFRDERLRLVKAATVCRELALIGHALTVAATEWGVVIPTNPVRAVRKPQPRDSRERRLACGELSQLERALMGSRNPHLRPAILLAIETGLRRGELLGLAWRHIDLGGRTAHIPITKNGKARTIPLTAQAVQILQTLSQGSGKVFPLTPVALRLGWERLRCRAGLPDLRFHDLRHEALSRFAELGLSTVELAAISGHQDLRMLSRYTHLRAEDLAAKIASLASP